MRFRAAILSFLTLALLAGLLPQQAQAVDLCWKQTYGRGVGTIPTNCGSKQYDAGLCYVYCASGYNGVGPMCWGTGLNWFSSYGRGVGTIPSSCASGQQYDAGLCYTPCQAGYTGIGPLCWKGCGGSFPVNCGAACAVSTTACVTGVTSQVESAIQVLQTILSGSKALGKAGLAVTKETVKTTLLNTAKSAGKQLTDTALESASTTVVDAVASGQFDWYSLDPTGLMKLVDAYNKPIC